MYVCMYVCMYENTCIFQTGFQLIKMVTTLPQHCTQVVTTLQQPGIL